MSKKTREKEVLPELEVRENHLLLRGFRCPNPYLYLTLRPPYISLCFNGALGTYKLPCQKQDDAIVIPLPQELMAIVTPYIGKTIPLRETNIPGLFAGKL